LGTWGKTIGRLSEGALASRLSERSGGGRRTRKGEKTRKKRRCGARTDDGEGEAERRMLRESHSPLDNEDDFKEDGLWEWTSRIKKSGRAGNRAPNWEMGGRGHTFTGAKGRTLAEARGSHTDLCASSRKATPFPGKGWLEIKGGDWEGLGRLGFN